MRLGLLTIKFQNKIDNSASSLIQFKYIMSVLICYMTYQLTAQSNDIMELEIADGLKELLIERGFTRHKILKIQSSQLASILGIEDYVGKIIYNAAKAKS